MNSKTICPKCGTRLMHYKHRLSVPLVDALYKLHEHGRAKIADLDITHSQYNNFHKLKYWNLIRQVDDCQYEISPLGELFLRGEISIPSYAITYQGKVEKLDGNLVDVRNLDRKFWVREDYRKHAV